MKRTQAPALPAGIEGLSAEARQLLNDRLARLATTPDAPKGAAIQTTHQMRLAKYKPADSPEGTLLYETNTGTTYIQRGGHWMYQGGVSEGTKAAQPAALTPHDVGYLYLAADTQMLYRWDGTGWVEVLDGSPPDAPESPVLYDNEIEELRQLISGVPAPRFYEMEIEELQQQLAAMLSMQQTQALTAGDIPDLSATYGLVGFPGAYAKVALTNQTASIGSTNVQHASAVLPAGEYLVMVRCDANPTGAITLAGSISWKDDRGITGVGNFGPGGTSAAMTSSNVFAINCDGVVNLTFTTTLTGTATYNITVTVLRIS